MLAGKLPIRILRDRPWVYTITTIVWLARVLTLPDCARFTLSLLMIAMLCDVSSEDFRKERRLIPSELVGHYLSGSRQ